MELARLRGESLHFAVKVFAAEEQQSFVALVRNATDAFRPKLLTQFSRWLSPLKVQNLRVLYKI